MAPLFTIVSTFGDSAAAAAAGVSITLDEVGNGGKTVFAPGDPQYLLIVVPSTYRLLSVKSTSGSVAAVGPVSRPYTEERKLFAESGKKEQLTYYPDGVVSAKWYGVAPQLIVDGLDVSVAQVPALADITYEYAALQYRLESPPGLTLAVDEEWPVGVVVYVEEIKTT